MKVGFSLAMASQPLINFQFEFKVGSFNFNSILINWAVERSSGIDDVANRNGQIMMFNPPTLQIKAGCAKISVIH